MALTPIVTLKKYFCQNCILFIIPGPADLTLYVSAQTIFKLKRRVFSHMGSFCEIRIRVDQKDRIRPDPV